MSERPLRCEGCVFARSRTVSTRGNPSASLMIIAESPGHNEARKNSPLVGDSGALLEKAMPVSLDDPLIYIDNAFCCQPGGKDVSKVAAATRACQERLLANIALHPRQAILALGNAAMWSTTGDFSLKITRERGKNYPSSLAEKGIFIGLHPAYLLRGGGNYKQFCEDVGAAFNAVGIKPKSIRKAPKKVITNPTIHVVTTANFNEHIATLEATTGQLTGDIETSGFDRQQDDMLCLGVAAKPSEVFIFTPQVLSRAKLKRLLEKREWIWQNGKFDIAFFNEKQIKAKVAEDTMLLSYCLNEFPGFHDLDQLAQEHLGTEPYKNMLDQYLPNKATSYSEVPTEVLYEYCGKDLVATSQVHAVLRPRVAKDANLERLYTKTLIPASNFLYKVEGRGMHIDQEILQENRERLTVEVAEAQETVNEHAPDGFLNPNAWADVAHVVYDQLELKIRGGGKKNTRKETLVRLVPKHPIIDAILAFRTKGKQLSTYVNGVENHLGLYGRIYITLLLHGTKTGRLASRNPNVQNIPRAKEMRNMFRSRPGRVLLKADLNQAELRVLAVLSGDKWMLGIFRDNTRDLHDEMSEFLFGPNWTSEQRMRAKGVNFGIPYGRTEYSLALEFDQTVEECARWISDWFERAPGAKDFIKKCRRAPREEVTLITPFGRKRRFGVVSWNNIDELENEAANFPIQSIASDITLHGAMRADDELEAIDALIINLVHDEILVDCISREVAVQAAGIIQRHIQDVATEWISTDLPFPVSFNVGTHWGDLGELSDAAA